MVLDLSILLNHIIPDLYLGETYNSQLISLTQSSTVAPAASARCKVISCPHPSERAAGAGAERTPCCCTVAVAGAGAEKLPCRTVATAGAGAKVSSAVTSSHCSSIAAWHICVLKLDG